MLEETTAIITGDLTGYMILHGIGFLVLVGMIVYIGLLFATIIKSIVWFETTANAYKVGMIKKHAEDNHIELCYEPKNKPVGLMQQLENDVNKNIEE